MRARSGLIPIAIARLIDQNLVTDGLEKRLRNERELYCVVGKRKSGEVIMQGGGLLHSDRSGRINSSSFKLVFNSEDDANEYINWLVTDPKDAYGPVLRRAIGRYDEQGKYQQPLIPPEKFHDPFLTNPAQVIIKDYRHTEPVILKSK